MGTFVILIVVQFHWSINMSKLIKLCILNKFSLWYSNYNLIKLSLKNTNHEARINKNKGQSGVLHS